MSQLTILLLFALVWLLSFVCLYNNVRKPYLFYHKKESNLEVWWIVERQECECLSNFIFGDNIACLKIVIHGFKIIFHKNMMAKAMIVGFPRALKFFGFTKFGDIISDYVGEECAIGN